MRMASRKGGPAPLIPQGWHFNGSLKHLNNRITLADFPLNI